MSRIPEGSSPEDVSKRRSNSADSSVTDPRGYDPIEFESDRVIVPKTFDPQKPISGHFESSEENNKQSDSSTVRADVFDEQIDTLNSQAYRIQIYTSKVYGDARQALKVAEEIFDRPVFIDYEVPNFKVRVGNFAKRAEAEEYQQRVKSAGFTTAWVVMVTVQPKEAPPLYDTYLLEKIGVSADSAAGGQDEDE